MGGKRTTDRCGVCMFTTRLRADGTFGVHADYLGRARRCEGAGLTPEESRLDACCRRELKRKAAENQR